MSDDVLDLEPLIRKRKQAECQHVRAEVSLSTAELDCMDCGAPLDPWWYLRKMVSEEERFREHTEALQRWFDKTVEDGNKKIAWLNAQIERGNRELARLIDTKNELWNERAPDGRPLGAHAARRRRRRA